MKFKPTEINSDKDPVSTLGLTHDQNVAYTNLLEFLNAPSSTTDYKRALAGAAGTGKTYLIKALIRNCKKSYSIIGLAAPTHKACRVLKESININNIKVNTLQSDLGLRLNFNVDNFNIDCPPFDPRGRIKIGAFKLYIVDEASMIPEGLIKFLEKICKDNECKIIYIGDSYQLPPVNEKVSSAFKTTKTYKLNQIVRQDDDNPVKELLGMLRYDIEHASFTFLDYIYRNKSKFDVNNTKGYKVCNSKEFYNMVYTNFNDEQLNKNVDFVKVIGYTNVNINSWNNYIRNNIIKDADKSIITKNDLITSYVTLVNDFNDIIISNSEEYIIHDIVNYTHPDYNIKGFLIKFQAIYGGNITTPLFVINHKDVNSIQKYVSISNELINKAKCATTKFKPAFWKEYYKFKEGCLLLTNIRNSQGKILFSRDLDYGFSLTAHKSQGSTFDTTLVDVNDIVYNRYGHPYTNAEDINRRLYVACSRCKNKLYLRYGK